MPIRRSKIQRAVNEVLDRFAVMEPPVPVRRIARGLGARIYQEEQDGDISGFLYKTGSEIVIGVNTRQVPVRQRFTIAHECGHLVLHDLDELHVDRDFIIRLRSDVSSLGLDTDEMEANRFAAELLMPTRFLKDDLEGVSLDLTDDGAFRTLAKRYGVSVQALTIRLTGLGYLPTVELATAG
jgi:Zn-dependent peptidase ImmA (M78 family)